jgi:hypothetical protein
MKGTARYTDPLADPLAGLLGVVPIPFEKNKCFQSMGRLLKSSYELIIGSLIPLSPKGPKGPFFPAS